MANLHIRLGRPFGIHVDTAMIGGAHLMLSQQQSRLCHMANMLAEDGRCKTLDANAD